MNVAIIGGGFTGLTAAYELSKAGHRVTVFEKEKTLGGLAYGFKENPPAGGWDWYLEAAYHHLFTNDQHILKLLKELDVPIITKRPITANLLVSDTRKNAVARGGISRNDKATGDKIFADRFSSFKTKILDLLAVRRGYWVSQKSASSGARKFLSPGAINADLSATQMAQLDSPFHLLRFPTLSLIDKFRTAFAVGFLKLFPFWKLLEGLTAEQFLISIGGKSAWRTIWEPLLYGKFGPFAPSVSLAWFWARIVKRTPSLCYIEGGFHTLVTALEIAIKKNGGAVVTEQTLTSLPEGFDRTLLTVPTPIAFKLVPQLLTTHYSLLTRIPHLHAQTLILETDKPILKDVYWLNVTDRSFPFLAAVAHTNFMDPAHYGGHHLTYFGNYLPQGHPYLSMTKEQLLKKFTPFIKRLLPSPNYQLRITNSFMFTGPYAQPVHELHYSQKIPPIKTPIPGIYMANMDYVVPWDRGTNYAVALGIKAANIILSSK